MYCIGSKKRVAVMLSSLLFASSLNAFTLQDAVLEAISTSPVAKERLGNFRETQQDLNIAKAGWLPKADIVSTIGVAQAGNFKNDIERESYNYYTNSLKITQNIFNGFSTTHQIEYQEARILAAAYHYVENVNDIAFQTVGAYLDLIRSYKLVQIAQDSLEINEKIYSDVQELYNAGLTTSSEVTKIQSSLALARSNLMVQKNNAKDKEFRVKRLLGRYVYLSEVELPKLNIPMPESIERATMISIRSNPSIMVSDYNIQGAKALYHESKSKFYPIVNAEVEQLFNGAHKKDNGYDKEDDRTRAYISLTWNIFNGGADKAAMQKQKINIFKEVEIQRDLKRQVMEGLELSWSAYTMIQGQLEHLYQYREFSKQTLSNYMEEYELGRRTLLDLLSAQNDLTNSESEITNAEFDRLYAQYRILDAMGMLVETIAGDTTRYNEVITPIRKPFVEEPVDFPVSRDVEDDTIVDALDICDDSLPGTSIQPYGCRKGLKDSDQDGVADIFDKCPDSRIGAVVDESGCEIEGGANRLENDPEMFLKTPEQYDETSPKKSDEDGLYDYKYSPKLDQNVPSREIDKKLMYGEFEVIKRFKAISMNGEAIDVKPIVEFYDTLGDGERIITVIGHTEGMNDLNKSKKISMEYADRVKNELIKAGIDSDVIIGEGRADLDKAFLEVRSSDKALNNRVMVSIYKPKEGLKDSDGDGVMDIVDKCPNTPEGIKVDSDGCPLDSDGDGVPDHLDKCPDTPKGYKVDASGCTELLNLEVKFAVNSAEIREENKEKIKEFAGFLIKHPTFNTVITGHSSIYGNETRNYNIALSKRRADSVKKLLVELGVSPSRIETAGKGPDEPIATNDTEEGREANQRIEATLIDKGVKAGGKQGESTDAGAWGI